MNKEPDGYWMGFYAEEVMPEKLSDHFTFEELTETNHEELQEENRKEAVKYKDNLTRVAKELLEPIRNHFGVPVKVTSGYRGTELNELVGGSITSQHCRGEAGDIEVRGYTTREKKIEVIKWIIDNIKEFGQLLLERDIVHISLGKKREIKEYSVKDKKKIPIKELF